MAGSWRASQHRATIAAAYLHAGSRSATTPPTRPKIFHITHVDNLRSIVAAGELLSDASMIARGGPQLGIGMSTIKQRRLALPVTCHASDHVGDYVPFYFCPRSIMLFVIHCANHPDHTYRGGQAPIVHMQGDLHAVVAWARQHNRRWAFSLRTRAQGTRPSEPTSPSWTRSIGPPWYPPRCPT